MGRDRRLYVEDILQSCEVVQHFVQGRDRSAIVQDSHMMDVLLHNIEIIGDAVAHIPKKFHADIIDADWEALCHLSDNLADGHAEENDEVWHIIETVIPSILESVRYHVV